MELDGVTSLLNEAEGKNIKLSKDISTLNSQLQDAQVSHASETALPSVVTREDKVGLDIVQH